MNQTEKKKANILTMTDAMLKNRIISDITVEEIAEKAEVSKVTLFKYYKSKEKLINHVLRHALFDMVDQMKKIVAQDLSFEETYLAITRFKVLQVKTFTPVFIDNIMSQFRESPEFFDIDSRAIQSELFNQLIKKGRAEGKVNPDYSDEELHMFIKLFDEGMKGVDINYVLNHSETLSKMFMNALK